jgi:hypothetical protein
MRTALFGLRPNHPDRCAFGAGLVVVLSSMLVCTQAHADPPEAATAVAWTPAPPKPQATSSAKPAWGWIVLGSGLVVGGTITGYGLSLDCHDDERACNKRAGISIWGGIGIAALASAIGLALIGSKEATSRR